jgi:hypothetical protein
LSISSNTLFAQTIDENFEKNDVAKIKYTVLDKDSKRFSSFWEATKGEISFELIELENLNNNQTIYGVEININRSETEIISRSIGFCNIGSLWGISSNATYKNIENNGYIFLDSKDIETVINFLNGIVGVMGQVQDKFTLYKISIRKQFELGMVYDTKSGELNKWGFIFSIDNSTYRLNFQDGISMLQSLSRFNNFIKSHQTL